MRITELRVYRAYDYDAEEESENEDVQRSYACGILSGAILALIVYRLIGPVIKIDLKASISKNEPS